MLDLRVSASHVSSWCNDTSIARPKSSAVGTGRRCFSLVGVDGRLSRAVGLVARLPSGAVIELVLWDMFLCHFSTNDIIITKHCGIIGLSQLSLVLMFVWTLWKTDVEYLI